MDGDTLKDLEQQALQVAMKSGKIEDLEKAVSIAKLSAEAQKVVSDRTNQPKVLRYEEFKTWAALLVPLLSVGTLAVTIFIQTIQLKATREANEATEWRETMKNVLAELHQPATSVPDPALAMTLLEPYTANGRFARDADLLCVELLSRVPSSDRFRDFFLSHHLGEENVDVPLLVALDRDMYSNLREVEKEEEQIQQQPAQIRSERADNLSVIHDSIVDDLEFITGKLCALYRHSSGGTKSTDLRDMFLMNGDLSDLDLTDADLSGSKLQNVELTNAVLTGEVKFKEAHFVDSNWWEARAISAPLLTFLTQNNYPYFDNDNLDYSKPPPPKDQYTARIVTLCKSAGITYDPTMVKYGAPPQPENNVTVASTNSITIGETNTPPK